MADGAQYNHTKDTRPTQHTTQHLGTHQNPSQYPGINGHFSQHPGTIPFSTQQITDTTHYPTGFSQFSPQHLAATQHSKTHPEEASQYTGTSKFPGPPLYTPYLGTAQYPGTNQQFEERSPYAAGLQFQQTPTQLNSGIHFTSGNSLPTLRNNGALNNTFNNDEVFETKSCSSAQPQRSNAYQFSGPNVEESPLERLPNVSEKGRKV